LINLGLAGVEGNIIGGDENKAEAEEIGVPGVPDSPPVFRERNDEGGKEEEKGNGEDNSDPEETAASDNLVGALYTLSVEELEEEMTIDPFFVPNVAVRGTGMSVRHRDVLMLCVDFSGRCILESIDISADPKDPSKGRVDVDLSPALSVPETRFPDEWVNQEFGNPVLAEMFCN
jgi:hypothetical protein